MHIESYLASNCTSGVVVSNGNGNQVPFYVFKTKWISDWEREKEKKNEREKERKREMEKSKRRRK